LVVHGGGFRALGGKPGVELPAGFDALQEALVATV